MCLHCDIYDELNRRLDDPGLPATERPRVEQTLRELAGKVEHERQRAQDEVPEAVVMTIKGILVAALDGSLGVTQSTLKRTATDSSSAEGEPVWLLVHSEVVKDTPDPTKVWTRYLPLAIVPDGGINGLLELVNSPEGHHRGSLPHQSKSPLDWAPYVVPQNEEGV